MTSEKFNELADVIAERAARKIKGVERSNTTNSGHGYKSDRPRNRKTSKEKPIRSRVDSMLREGKKADEENSGKFGKINTKAFLKHDASSQELYLNYKHITKEFQKNIEAKMLSPKTDRQPVNVKPSQRGSNDNIFSDHSDRAEEPKPTSREKSMKDVKGKVRKSIQMKSRIDESSKKHSITSDKHSDEGEDFISNKTSAIKKITTNIKLSQENSEEDKTLKVIKEDSNRSVKKHKKISSSQTTKNNLEHTWSDSSNLENRKNTHTENTNESQEHKTEYSSREVVEVGINRALNEDSSEHYIEKNLDILVDKKPETKNLMDSKHVIRKENGKVYTFRSSPDYDEYHENVAQLRSKNSYINTYK